DALIVPDPVFFPLFLPSPGSLVQAVITQPASKSVNPGDTITCSGSSSWYGWYQQKNPGSAPVTMIYDSTKRPSDIPSRFSASTSGSMNTLTITGVQPRFLPSLLSLSRFPGPGTADSARLKIGEHGRNCGDHLLWGW
uniref:Immunoglobulin V-set domain-containing protein n=1 Tax=Anas platyrhynchos TaxID=8839 RepID=A0A8B9SK61_ANAPL